MQGREFPAARDPLGVRGRVLGQLGTLSALHRRLSPVGNLTHPTPLVPHPKHRFVFVEMAATPISTLNHA